MTTLSTFLKGIICCTAIIRTRNRLYVYMQYMTAESSVNLQQVLCEEHWNFPFCYSSESSVKNQNSPSECPCPTELQVSEKCLSSGNMRFGSAVSKVSVHCFKSVSLCACSIGRKPWEEPETDGETPAAVGEGSGHSQLHRRPPGPVPQQDGNILSHFHTHTMYNSLFLFFVRTHLFTVVLLSTLLVLLHMVATHFLAPLSTSHTFTNTNQSLCRRVRINYLYWTSPSCLWNLVW